MQVSPISNFRPIWPIHLEFIQSNWVFSWEVKVCFQRSILLQTFKERSQRSSVNCEQKKPRSFHWTFVRLTVTLATSFPVRLKTIPANVSDGQRPCHWACGRLTSSNSNYALALACHLRPSALTKIAEWSKPKQIISRGISKTFFQ